MRRDPRTNNFKAVLSTIRQLLNTECVVPDWIHDIILGYGDAHSAHYKQLVFWNHFFLLYFSWRRFFSLCISFHFMKDLWFWWIQTFSMNNVVASLDFCDTFISYKHLLASFPSQKIVTSNDDPSLHPPPYRYLYLQYVSVNRDFFSTIWIFRLTFKELEPQHNVDLSQRDTSIFVESYVVPSRGPYPHVEPRKNAILFTPAQVNSCWLPPLILWVRYFVLDHFAIFSDRY